MVDPKGALLAFQLTTLFSIVLDIPFLRQVLGFIYLTFVPGILILSILDVEFEDVTSRVLIVVGLSLAFLMFSGLLVNELYPLAHVSRPLDAQPLIITIFVTLLTTQVLSYKKIKFDLPFRNVFYVKNVFLTFVITAIPVLSLIGVILIDRTMMLLSVAAVGGLVLCSVFFRKSIPTAFHWLIILSLAAAVLVHIPFLGKHITGWDIFGEFYVFRLTKIGSFWDPKSVLPEVELSAYNSMLSVTILPTMFENLLKVSGESVFKVIYIVYYSLVPLALYKVYENRFGKAEAFLSAFYFILFPRFYLEERRQIVAELFLVLLVMLMFSEDKSPRRKGILFTIFSFALVVSHYSISYIFIFWILSGWIIYEIIQIVFHRSLSLSKSLIKIENIFLIFSFTIFWIIFLSPALALDFQHLISKMALIHENFFIIGSRGEMISDFIAPQLKNTSLIYKIDLLINKVPYALIVIGFIYLIKNRDKLKVRLEFILLSITNIFIFILILIVPFIAPSFGAHRIFHISLVILAPVSVLGGKSLLAPFLKPFKQREAVSLCLLGVLFVVIFLFKVGFVQEIYGDVPISRALSYDRMKTSSDPTIRGAFYEPYASEMDVQGAVWLMGAAEDNHTLYADFTANKHVLRAYALTVVEWENFLSSEVRFKPDSYIYLREFNGGGYFSYRGGFMDMTPIYEELVDKNKIFSNGCCDLYLSSR